MPPGRARLSTKPAPTGSETFVNTIGTKRQESPIKQGRFSGVPSLVRNISLFIPR